MDNYWGRHRAPSPTDESRAWPERYARMGYRPGAELHENWPEGSVTLAVGPASDYAPSLLRGRVFLSRAPRGLLAVGIDMDEKASVEIEVWRGSGICLMWKEGLA